MFLWIKKVIVPCHQATTAKFIRTFLVNDFNFRKVLLLNIHAIKGVLGERSKYFHFIKVVLWTLKKR